MPAHDFPDCAEGRYYSPIFRKIAVVFVLFTLGERVLRALPSGLILVINLVFGLFVMAIGVELVVHGIANHGAIVRVR